MVAQKTVSNNFGTLIRSQKPRSRSFTIVIVVVVVVCVLVVIAGALLAFRYRQLLPKWVFMSKNDENPNNPKEYRLM